MAHPWHSSQGRMADLLVDQFLDGEVCTPGQYAMWINTLASLSSRHREWVISQIEPAIGLDGVARIRVQLPLPGPWPAPEGVTTV